MILKSLKKKDFFLFKEKILNQSQILKWPLHSKEMEPAVKWVPSW